MLTDIGAPTKNISTISPSLHLRSCSRSNFTPLFSPCSLHAVVAAKHYIMNVEQQTKARKLFLQTDLTKTEIANALGIPRRTLHHWIKEHNWEFQKQCASQMPVAIAENCYHILANYTEQLLSPERKDVLLSHKEAETIHKLTVTISKLKNRATLSENMELFNNFLHSLHATAPEVAAAVTPFVNSYLAAGAAISAAVPGHIAAPPTPEEAEAEHQLDLRYEAEEQARAQQTVQTQQAHQTPHTTTQRPPVTLSAKIDDAATRRHTPPPYNQLLEDFRRQDEHIRHLYQPAPARTAAA